ncbi:MAG: hypothetical protein U0Q18_09845 [Bryobacteraceae bacterium]
MAKLTSRTLLAIIFGITVPLIFGSNAVIGTVVTKGSFQLNQSRSWSNATVFEGSQIETTNWAAQVRLSNGADVQLASESRARVYETRLVLERGIGQVDSEKYAVEAGGLRISPNGAGSIARVAVNGPKTVQVAAYQGSVIVRNQAGLLLAKLENGNELAFEPPAQGASTTTQISGCVTPAGSNFTITDETTNVTMALRGSDLQKAAGNRVEVTGTSEAGPGGIQILHVTSMTVIGKGKCAVAAGKSAGKAGAGKTAGVGLSSGAKVAIIGGVAAAATVGGLGLAEALPGQGPSSNSR